MLGLSRLLLHRHLLRGRLQFAESQTFGRAINLFMRACNSRATGTRPGAGIDEDMLLELKWAQGFVSEEVPRVLKVDQSQVKVLIFTDACLEDDDTTWRCIWTRKRYPKVKWPNGSGKAGMAVKTDLAVKMASISYFCVIW